MFSLGEWSPRVPTGFHVSRGTWEPDPRSPSRFRLRGYHPLWRNFPDPSANGRFGNSSTSPQLVRSSPTTPDRQRLRAITPAEFRLFPVRSPLLGESRLLSFPRGTEMFQFPRFASAAYGFSGGYASITSRGFPHSGIRGSMPACGFPRLIAACHALHRFLAPRHPPSALSSLTTDISRTIRRRSGFSRIAYAVVKEPRDPKAPKSRHLVEMTGFEPATPCVQGRCSPS
jgi:hypothetical protein